MLKGGDCFWDETGSSESDQIVGHFFVIAFDPVGKTRTTIIVTCSTIRSKKYDDTTFIPARETGFIKSDSYIRYSLTRDVSADDIEKKINEGSASKRESIGEELLARICDGILKSKFTPLRIKLLYQDLLHDKLLR